MATVNLITREIQQVLSLWVGLMGQGVVKFATVVAEPLAHLFRGDPRRGRKHDPYESRGFMNRATLRAGRSAR